MARGKQHFSATSIDDANYCIMKYYLIRVERVPTETLAVLVSGQVLHALGENFYTLFGKKYGNANEFCKYADGQWLNRIVKDEARAIELLVAMESSLIEKDDEKRASLESRLSKKGIQTLETILEDKTKLEKKLFKLTKGRIKTLNKELIVWGDDQEKWVIRDRIQKSSLLFYDWLISEGVPFRTELPFYFELKGVRYKGYIDRIDIRDGFPLISDYKTGSKPTMKEIKKRKDPQLTLYGLSVSAKAYADPEFARITGLNGEAKLLMGHPKFISDKLKYRYVEVGKEEIRVSETTRDDKDYHQMRSMIDAIKKSIIDGNVYIQFGRKCDYCTVSKECVKRADKNYEHVKPGKTHFFDFMAPPYAQKPVEGEAIVTKKFRFFTRE